MPRSMGCDFMWKLKFNIKPAATVATTATDKPFPDNNVDSVATVAVVAREDELEKTRYSPIPKSTSAALEYLKRTNFERPLTQKLEAWLDKDSSIAAYERTIELLFKPP